MKSLKFRLAFFVGLVGVTLGLCQMFPNAALDPAAGVVMKLPDVIPGFTSREVEMSDEEKYWLPPETSSVKRVYTPIHGETADELAFGGITASIILSGGDRRSLHRPEVCMTGQGWTIEKREVVSLETEGGPLDVMDLYLKRKMTDPDGTEWVLYANYIYWWVGKEVSTPHSWQRILTTSLNNMFFNINDRWAYPSVMVYTAKDAGSVGRVVARDRALKYIQRYAPTFQKSLGAKGGDE
ncbi:exosortase-associated EpsI family protein [Sulfuriroseicoccus oceanibius]|uniref:Exosortase-associated EpsI family protein n=1 Tax=Sulfuriroseicoccus oceanibius TaxID=2707525 RepID=A0A6B3L4I5_9BACT|nr:exosortase-associated EpsI family protein [Sulfuriroseicoccus oceanibius]QQL45628.1 exosortase-associated EpsI family protein [Sulfuriroseicoccus oceanibius]